MLWRLPRSTLFPYTTLFRSLEEAKVRTQIETAEDMVLELGPGVPIMAEKPTPRASRKKRPIERRAARSTRSEEHTSELQSLRHLVCRLLLEKKKNNAITRTQ